MHFLKEMIFAINSQGGFCHQTTFCGVLVMKSLNCYVGIITIEGMAKLQCILSGYRIVDFTMVDLCTLEYQACI